MAHPAGLVWFLQGLCHLAMDEAEGSRESFMRSYSYDSRWVDDFLQRHEPSCEAGRSPQRPPGPGFGSTTLRPLRKQHLRPASSSRMSSGQKMQPFGKRPNTAGGGERVVCSLFPADAT